MDANRVQIQGKERKLLLQGECLELLPVCEAMCCREWDVSLQKAEVDSTVYDLETICGLTLTQCDSDQVGCHLRTFRLRRSPTGACVYLGDDNRCTIYETRPRVCRDFSCAAGWRLGSVLPAASEETGSGQERASAPGRERFVERLSDSLTFVSHPLLKLHTVFRLRDRGEIVFIVEMVGGCAKFNSRDSFTRPDLTEDQLLALIDLFKSKDDLGTVRRRFAEEWPIDLDKREFYELVWLLQKHRIVADTRAFKGMLAGAGRLQQDASASPG